jgi:hypothetical protein
MTDALNKLCKWRTVLAGWHHGTRSMNSRGTQAMRDLMDKWLIMRAETNAMAGLMIDKGLITEAELEARVQREAATLDGMMEGQFPGFRTFDGGVTIYDTALSAETTKRLWFPE